MRTHFRFFNLIALFALIFSVAFQSAHGMEHLFEELTTPQCVHQKTDSKHEITHEHHKEENCPVCHFSFSSSLVSDVFQMAFQVPVFEYSDAFSNHEDASFFFSGSLFSHRGPPASV